MKMGGFAGPGWNRVDVDIKYLGAFGHDIGNPGFFPGFAHRHAHHVAVSVGMPAQLKPLLKFLVVRQQDPTSLRIHQPG